MSLACTLSCTPGGVGEPDGTPAKELCHFSLTPAAVRALDRLSTGSAYREQPGALSYGEAVTRLRQHADVATSRSPVCRVRAPGGSDGSPLLQVEFVHPEAGAEPEGRKRRAGPGETRYATGEYAVARDSGAFLTFRCAGGLPEDTPPFVAGNIDVPFTDAHAKLGPRERGRAAMTILHAVARELAGRMGCREESRLAARAPAPLRRGALPPTASAPAA